MTLITPEDRLSETDELLQSLQASVRRVRQQAEMLCCDLSEGGDAELGNIVRQVSALEGLVRTCQKVEASLVEQLHKRAGIAQGGFALDLEQARSEVENRLDRIRIAGDAPAVPE